MTMQNAMKFAPPALAQVASSLYTKQAKLKSQQTSEGSTICAPVAVEKTSTSRSEVQDLVGISTIIKPYRR